MEKNGRRQQSSQCRFLKQKPMNVKYPKCVKPLNIPVSENETLEQFRERWAKIDALSEKEKDILSSDFTYGLILELSKTLGLSEGETADVSRLVRALVCGDIMREQLDLVLGKAFQRLDIDAISRIKVAISKILTQKTQTEEKAERMESVPIAAALKKYEKLGEQMITSGPIKLRVFPELVKPSIKNWIADYHDNLGAQKHGSIERGNYLFHSNNAKKLSSLERRRLAEVLKSLDGDGEVNVDPALQKILFENKTEQDMPENSSAREKVSSTKPAMEKKVENYFSVNSAPRSSFGFPSAPAKPSASETRTQSAVNPGSGAAPQFRPSFVAPSKKQEVPVQESPRKVWNPAEAVKRRMMEESGAAQSSPAPVSNPVPAPQSVPVPGQGNSIR
ncbi:MAG: hypothetical protein UX75_C0027G0001, partial [Candidatus Moranbacteria bacterium GW2011_GWE2_47_10]